MNTNGDFGSGEWQKFEIIQNTELTKIFATTVHGEREAEGVDGRPNPQLRSLAGEQ